MAIITPHESQAGIATGNAGQAAPYRSASAFMTPGQAALPNGINQLAHGMDRLGDAVFRMGIDRMKMRNATDLLADKVAYEDALRQFDSDYRQTHRGVSARDAEEAYAAFHQEQYDKLQKKWGGNPYLMEGVNRMAEGIRLPSMQRAVNYRDGEEEAYKKSVLQSSQAQTFAVFSDPSVSWEEKQRALEQEENNLRLFAGQQPVMVDGRTQWQGGREVTAEAMALRQKLLTEYFNAMLQSGNLDGAQAFLDFQSGTASAPGSLSQRNLAANNFGNVRNTKGNFVAYATPIDGLMGIGERIVRYTNAPERGWHAESLLDMAKIYAPKGDGANDPEKYAAFLGKKLGIDPTAKTNLRDPKILAGLIKWMPVMEHGAQRVSISDDEAMQATQAVLAGKKPKVVGEAGTTKRGPLYVAGTKPEGMVTPGNIDIANRPQVKMDDGGTATVRSMSVNMDGKEVLIPTISPDGRLLSDDEAIAEYRKTGKHLGMFDTPEHATAYAEKLHEQQERMYLSHNAGAASLLPASARFHFQASLDAARKRQEAEMRQHQEEADLGMAQRLIQETRDISAADRQRVLMDRLAGIPDQGRRDKVAAWCKRELAFEEERRKAQDMDIAMTLYEMGRKSQESPTQFLLRVTASNAPEQAKKQAIAMFNGKIEENELNMRALDELRLKIDEAERNSQPMSKDAVYRFAYDRRMTPAQLKAALSYLEDGGNLGRLKQSDVNSIYKELHASEDVKDKDIPTWLYDAVQRELAAGKELTRGELKKIVAHVCIAGTVPGKFYGRYAITRGEAIVQGKENVFEAGPDTEALENEDAQ